MRTSHDLGSEGVTAGIIGATAVAVWFLLVDLLAGHPLYTPALLGVLLTRALGSIFLAPSLSAATVDPDHIRASYVILYTVFHYAAFIATGVLAVALVHGSRRNPSVLALLLMLFVAFEVAFTAFASLLGMSHLRSLAWYQVAAGNLIAALSMGTYLWRTHPALATDLDQTLRGDV